MWETASARAPWIGRSSGARAGPDSPAPAVPKSPRRHEPVTGLGCPGAGSPPRRVSPIRLAALTVLPVRPPAAARVSHWRGHGVGHTLLTRASRLVHPHLAGGPAGESPHRRSAAWVGCPVRMGGDGRETAREGAAGRDRGNPLGRGHRPKVGSLWGDPLSQTRKPLCSMTGSTRVPARRPTSFRACRPSVMPQRRPPRGGRPAARGCLPRPASSPPAGLPIAPTAPVPERGESVKDQGTGSVPTPRHPAGLDGGDR